MSLVRKCLILSLSIAAASGADKDKVRFSPGPASSYPSKLTLEKLTVAAVPYESPDQARAAFGKLNPYQQGVLPILVVMQNDGTETLRVDRIKVEYVAPGERVEATSANDVRYLGGGHRPEQSKIPLPTGPRYKVKKGPLNDQVIEDRAFAARMLPAGESASGFFYFQTGHRARASLYLSGIVVASTGKELFYFEIPLEEK